MNLENQAISIHNAFDPAASVFVSANAGAGKTSMLTSRVLSLLLHGVAPSKILCLTYTKAAAGEMANRVLATLGDWVMDDEEELAKKLAEILGGAPDARLIARSRTLFAKVLEAPEGLRIQTIHGFCQSLLGRFPIEAGVSPHFSVVDSRTEQELLAEARTRLFNHARRGDSALAAALHRLAHRQSEFSFNKLISEIITQKRRFISLMHAGGMDAAIDDVWRALGTKKEASFEVLAVDFTYDANTLSALRSALATLSQCNGKYDQQTATALATWLENPKPEKLRDYILSYYTNAGTLRKTIFTKSLKDTAAVDALTAEVARVTTFYNAWMAHEVGSHTADVLTIAEALLGLYTDLKNAHAQMDYDDLILGAVHLLAEKNVAPWVLFKLDGGIDHILVDEAQDTSAEQWRIIDALTQEFFAGQTRSDAERSLFVVGDEKQSIFSFQGADPAALGTMQAYFKARINDAAKPVHALELTKSYRSTKEVLTAVDAVFALPRAKKGVMFLEGELAHVAHREGNGIVELWPLTKPDGEGEFATSARTCLARQIADTIAGWLENGEVIASRGRRITPGDIMILVQTRTVIVDRLTRALKKRGIPVAGQDRMELNDNLAVQDLLALGQVLLLPEDDLSLASVLKSPIFNFSEDDLFELAYGRGKQSLWERLHNIPKFAEALKLLQDLRSRADFIPPYELYVYLLDTLGARAKILGRMGVEYGDPIDEFLNQTLLYERAHAPSLQGFIHWLTHSQSQIKRDMEQANNAVRIMTVHGSKGLQAPIVFLPDTTKTPTVKESVFWLQREGKNALPLRATASENLDEVTRGVRDTRKEMELAEYRRLLYVALTRAEDRVYVCGALSRGDAPNDESWYALVREGLATVAQNMGEGMLRLGALPLSSSPPLREREDVLFPLTAGGRGREGALFFLKKTAPTEPSPPQPLSPSRLEGHEPAGASPLCNIALYERGNIIHALLQHLPNVAPEQREIAAPRIANLRAHGLSEDEVSACIREVLTVLNDERFAFVFGAGSLAEVPVAGCVELAGQKVAVSGQIDRLYIGEKEVWIVDFKSNRRPPQNAIPTAYIRQMQLYQRVLAAIYPQKPIRCALLWTATAEMTVLDEALLSSYI